jgi:hypothetical protein
MDINNDLINNLGVNVDISDINSWNSQNGFVLKSINNLSSVTVSDLNLLDYGLTAIDNGSASSMEDILVLDPFDNLLILNRVGYYSLTGNTITYDNYPLSPMTGTSIGTYFNLNGGYFQGFFKLDGYNYEIMPPRYNNGITVETLIELLPQSAGIFFMMGIRAEDKYNPSYSGEAVLVTGTTILYNANLTGNTYTYSGITTSNGNYLIAYNNIIGKLSAFQQPEYADISVQSSVNQIDNLKNNIIAFEVRNDKKMGCRYIDVNGNIISIASPTTINRYGWSLIDIVYTPDQIIDNYDPTIYDTYPQRTGNLDIYLNGGLFWSIVGFDEFYFKRLTNDSDKQIGVPYNICWGGGSFGLEYSLHYSDINKTSLVIDPDKSNLTIENYFNSSFIGNIQKLRMYDKALLKQEIQQNVALIANSNINYGISSADTGIGGRLIKKFNQPTTITQNNSGSDIRKSIKYRNSDGTYKNLYNMIDIMVVVKSRSNPNIELIKFKKIAETGWYALIYVNNYVYDFIVPNEITSLHPYEILYAEIKFQWSDPNDIDGIYDKIFVINITSGELNNDTVKNY